MEAKEKHLQAFVSLIGEAMGSLAERHKAEGLGWPAPEFVRRLKEETARRMIPLIVTGGSELSHGGGYRTEGMHEDLIRGGVKVGEFIKEPSNLFKPDGTINEKMGAVLVHEYCHALQDAAMEGMPETKKAMVPIPSIEHANQALADWVWKEMYEIMHSDEPHYVEIRERLKKAHKDAFDKLPQIDPETMRYQDMASKYPGWMFMAQHPEYFKEKGIEADVKDEHLESLAKDVARQVRAAEDNEDIPTMLRQSMDNQVIIGKIGGIEQFMKTYGKEADKILKPFKPAEGEHAENIVGFYARELKHLREIDKLVGMKTRINDLHPEELKALYDFAEKRELAADVRSLKRHELVDFALAHKFGELDANREGIAQAEGILGARLRELHRMGRDPEAKLERFADPEMRKFLDDMRSEDGRLREMRDRGKGWEDGKFKEDGKDILDRMRRKPKMR